MLEPEHIICGTEQIMVRGCRLHICCKTTPAKCDEDAVILSGAKRGGKSRSLRKPGETSRLKSCDEDVVILSGAKRGGKSRSLKSTWRSQ